MIKRDKMKNRTIQHAGIVFSNILKAIALILIYALVILRVGKRDKLKSIEKDVNQVFKMFQKAIKHGKQPP